MLKNNKCSNFKLSIVIPVYNETKNVCKLYDSILYEMQNIDGTYEIIFVNDGSTDSTLQLLRNLSQNNNLVKIISLSRNFSQQTATFAGIEYSTGDALIVMDADLQDPPNLINKMVNLYHEGFDVVHARRTSRKNESFLKKVSAKIFYRFHNILSDIKIPEDTGDFKLISKRVVNQIKNTKDNNEQFKSLIAYIGFKQTEILFERDSRHVGKSSYNITKLSRLAIDIITNSSSKPLEAILPLSICFAFFTLMTTIIYILNSIISGFDRAGGTLYLFVLLNLMSLQFVCIGVVAQYVKRLSDRSTDRPRYIVDKNKSVNIDE